MYFLELICCFLFICFGVRTFKISDECDNFSSNYCNLFWVQFIRTVHSVYKFNSQQSADKISKYVLWDSMPINPIRYRIVSDDLLVFFYRNHCSFCGKIIWIFLGISSNCASRRSKSLWIPRSTERKSTLLLRKLPITFHLSLLNC